MGQRTTQMRGGAVARQGDGMIVMISEIAATRKARDAHLAVGLQDCCPERAVLTRGIPSVKVITGVTGILVPLTGIMIHDIG